MRLGRMKIREMICPFLGQTVLRAVSLLCSNTGISNDIDMKCVSLEVIVFLCSRSIICITMLVA